MSEESRFARLLDIVFPRGLVCASCGREAIVGENGLCDECAEGLERFNAAPVIKGVDGFTAAYLYNDVSAAMVKRLKYNGARYLAPVLAGALEIPAEWQIDAAVPVPLHKTRLRQRGFNQSELIARPLCRRLDIPLRTDLLFRVRDTDAQTHRTARGRQTALKGAFLADDSVRGMRLLLVDDVRTTGATLRECAEELKRRGAASVFAAAVCFAKQDK